MRNMVLPSDEREPRSFPYDNQQKNPSLLDTLHYLTFTVETIRKSTKTVIILLCLRRSAAQYLYF